MFQGNLALKQAGFGGTGAAALYDNDNDAFTIPTEDGGVIIQFGQAKKSFENEKSDHFRNLADSLSPAAMGALAWELLDGIAADDQSRQQWISDRERGLDLLAIKIEKPRADIGGSGAPMDGMSTVRHPLLLEASIRYQANAKRELLPAAGPVQVANDGPETLEADQQAEKEQDLFNDILTRHRPEYYPDTDRMFFEQGWSGMGVKKIYECPLRRMGVSDTVPVPDFIVSNEATDLRTAQRITQRLVMTRNTIKRMQYVGAYRPVELSQPDQDPIDRVTSKQKRIAGIDTSTRRPQDRLYTLYECYTSLDLEGDEHEDEDGERTGLPRPYKITIDKSSRQILEIRRNWEEDSEDNFEPIQVFVVFPFVPMFGFYPTGLLHILGNTTMAVTAAWRILLDSGMFSNFPGFLYAKNGARQDNLNFRIAPGSGTALDLNGQDDIRKTIMAVPYKSVDAAFQALVDSMISTGRQVGGAAEAIDPSSIRQNMPVGTTMMLVEQAQQTMSAVHERTCVAQRREFELLHALWRKNPKSIWRLIASEGKWTFDELSTTLNKRAFTPVADPNTPTHLHRIMKMTTLKQLEQSAPPGMYDPKAVDTAIMQSIKIPDPNRFFMPPPPPNAPPPPPSDAVVIAQATQQAKQMETQSRERIEASKQQAAMRTAEAKNHLDAMKLEVQRLDTEMSAQIEMMKLKVTAETADSDRSSVELIEGAKLAQARSMEHIRAQLEALGHHVSSYGDEIQRQHDADQADLDRDHEIQLEKVKPKPRPVAGK